MTQGIKRRVTAARFLSIINILWNLYKQNQTWHQQYQPRTVSEIILSQIYNLRYGPTIRTGVWGSWDGICQASQTKPQFTQAEEAGKNWLIYFYSYSYFYHVSFSQPNFGICFDCDGVLARGTLPIKSAKRAFKKLVDDKGQFVVPVTFVTNSLSKNSDKAKMIGEWFGVEVSPIVAPLYVQISYNMLSSSCCQVSPDQMVQAQGPLEMFTEYHNKHCLIIGQGKVSEIAKEYPCSNLID